MTSEPIHITDDSELPRLFDEADKGPVEFERKGAVYRLVPVESAIPDASSWDRDAYLEALADIAGSITDEEAEDMKQKLYEYRRIGSRPRWRP